MKINVLNDKSEQVKETLRFHIGWRREQNILYKGVETSP